MSPRLVLSLWRERWGDAAAAEGGRPYLRGRLTRWGESLTHSGAWSLPGLSYLALLGCVVIYTMVMTARFSLGGQVAFSVLFIGVALYIRRYAGTLVTLVLLGMLAIISTRYLYWRVTQTLGHDFNLDFVLGMGLCLVEFYLLLLIMLRHAQIVWPLMRASVPLSTDTVEWPRVDVFVMAQRQNESTIRQTALAALSLDWPKAKIKTYILDEVRSDRLQGLADSIGVGYLVPQDAVDGQSGLINFALSQTQGDLVLMLDGAQTPDRSLLKAISGWFVRDKTLGMLQTPHHFLAPAPSANSLALCQMPTLPGNVAFAVLRRAMLTEVGGVAPGLVTAQTHTALQLQAQGYGHGYIGCTKEKAAHTALEQADIDTAGASSTLALFRVDSPFLGRRLRWKQHFVALQSMLQFYYIVPRLVFFTVPLAYLLAGVHLVQATPEFMVAYGLPYLLFVHLTQMRLRGGGRANRLPTWVDLRESLLAWYLLIPTTLTLLRTELSRCLGVVKVDPHAPFDRWVVGFYGLIALLNLAGFAAGIVRLPFLQSPVQEVAALYLLWCVCNLMLLAALLAVAEETRHIRQQTRLLLQMPAMVQMSSGRTLACMTQNFPQPVLLLKLPVPLEVEVGSSINLSIFRGHAEFTFPACVLSQHNGMLTLRIEDAVKDDYRLFGAAVLSRGTDWPQWLPGRNADHPLPSWVTWPFITVWTKLREAGWSFDKFLTWSRLDHWIGK